MIITTREGRSFDTERDLTAPERHVLQKLFLWETLATSVEEFREKTREALQRGWNDSGPIRGSSALKQIISHLENKVLNRISER
ncbi:MAG: hypothetical protein JRJ03_03960 [Deltaproteobacteria bacterium]|nr:hypothetical protein [Deltaproteobacteria bacterium]